MALPLQTVLLLDVVAIAGTDGEIPKLAQQNFPAYQKEMVVIIFTFLVGLGKIS
jgi:hypothetical protein